MLPTGQQAWLVTKHADVRALLADNRISSDRSHPDFPMRGPAHQQLRKGFSDLAKALIGLDLPEHTAPRRMAAKEFTVRRINELRPRIQQIVDERIDAMLAAGPGADLVTDLATQVPSSVICELLGVPLDSRDFFQERTQILVRQASTPQQQFDAADELRQFMDDLVTAKEREPSDDLLGRLIVRNRETKVFTHDLLVGHRRSAGRTEPDGHDHRGDSALLPDLRRDGPAGQGGHQARRGDDQGRGRGDARARLQQRDEASFTDPDTFDVHRGDRHHLTFGYGIHHPDDHRRLPPAGHLVADRGPGSWWQTSGSASGEFRITSRSQPRGSCRGRQSDTLQACRLLRRCFN